MKFINLLKSKERIELLKELNGEELREAENLWIQSIQRNSFPEKHKQLQKDKTVIYKGQFQLFLSDQKFIRCKGHLGNANLPETMKHPAYLSRRHYFTELLIRESHKLVHHDGVSETLACLRENYWISEAVKL